ncbi:MAG: hypothetical protein ABWX85_02455 [Arthrobacter sp.]
MTQTTVPVIFDLDGTLVDPAGGISYGIAAARTELGIGVPGKPGLDAMIGPKLSRSLTDTAGVPAEQLDEAIGIHRAHHLATGPDRIGVGWGFAPDGELDAAGAAEIVHSSVALRDTIARRDAARALAATGNAMSADLKTEALDEVHNNGNV